MILDSSPTIASTTALVHGLNLLALDDLIPKVFALL